MKKTAKTKNTKPAKPPKAVKPVDPTPVDDFAIPVKKIKAPLEIELPEDAIEPIPLKDDDEVAVEPVEVEAEEVELDEEEIDPFGDKWEQ